MRYIPLVLIIGLITWYCSVPEAPPALINYTTQSDSTLFYYNRGWQQIMDEGLYGPAESTYRKALSFDPNFLVGKSVLARLTTDQAERLALYQAVEQHKHLISGDERLVLDVYQAFVHFTNARTQQPAQAKSLLDDALRLAVINLGKVARHYPGETYIKAEYIEVIHRLHGPRAALDSLYVLADANQLSNPFLLGYAALMEAELEEFDHALTKAKRLAQKYRDQQIPKPKVILADLYFRMDSLKKAAAFVNEAVRIDSSNLDARRLKAKVDAALNSWAN